MPLVLVTGPANAAKAGEVLGAFRAAAAAGPATLVVPTAADELHYRRELARGGALLGGTVTRFAGLMARVAERAGAETAPLGPHGRRRAVGAAIARARLDRLAASAASAGFPAALEEVLDELGRGLVEPSALAGAPEVAALWRSYRRVLSDLGRLDRPGAQRAALQALRSAPGAWGREPVFLYGFDDFSPLQLAGVQALAGEAEVWVSLTWEGGRRALGDRADVHAALGGLAAEERVLPAAADHYAPGSARALHHLERTLFEAAPAGAAGAPDPGRAIALLEAGGERAEAELVAAECLRLLADGIAAEEIGIVARDGALSPELLARVLEEYGVPYAEEREVPLPRTGLGGALLALLRLGLGTATAADLVGYLRAPGLLPAPEPVDRLEEEARRRGLDAARARARWEAGARHPLEEVDRVAAAARGGGRALAGVLAAEAARLAALPHVRRAAVPEGPARADLLAAAAAAAALEELGELPPGLAPAPAELEALLGEVGIVVGEPAGAGAVTLSDPLGVRARRFRAVLVTGLQEGAFPRRGRPDPFLGDDARAAVGLPRRDAADAHERFLFYAACSRATERLVLSYRVADDEGDPDLPSSFLDDVRDCFPGALQQAARSRPLADVTWPPALAPTPVEAARSRAARGPRRVNPPLTPLRAPAILGRLAGEVLSAGALERYAGCPAAWLVERRLAPGRLAPDEEALARGSVLHEVLERTLSALRDGAGSARVTPERLEEARAVLDETLAAVVAQRPLHPQPAIARAQAERARRDLHRFLEHEAAHARDWEPVAFELDFGFEEETGEGLPALELAGGEVRLRGKVDRVEVDAGGRHVAVRDYKSGAVQPVARWADEDRLQVALYLRAVQRGWGLPGAAALYQPLRGDLRPRGLWRTDAAPPDGDVLAADGADPEAFERALGEAEERAVALARRLRSGALDPRPERCGFAGGGCRYPGVCRTGA